MGVPEEVRKVQRPVNTIVVDSGVDSPNRYAVRERKCSGTYVPGGNPKPINGAVIGHIINYEFVPLAEENTDKAPSMLSWGTPALIRAINSDIVHDLLQAFTPVNAYTIMSIASVKIMKPGVTGSRMAVHYRNSYLSLYYPNASMSRNSISKLYEELGMNEVARRKFYERRLARVTETHHIAIDGTLKQNTSIVNDLSNFSYKARMKGCKEISILYAYDIANQEPICAQVFPGNQPDMKSYREFVASRNLTKGLIVADKGFPSVEIQDLLAGRPELHFLNPIKRNSKLVEQYELTKYQETLKGLGDRKVLAKKVKIEDGTFLYSFCDMSISADERIGYLEKLDKNKQDFSIDAFEKKSVRFGMLILHSDKDMTSLEAYTIFDSRWVIELAFGYYKANVTSNKTDVQSDFSVIGAEFVNFIATLLSCRIVEKARKVELLNDVSYGDLIDDLNSCWRLTDAPNEKPKYSDEYWVHASIGAKNLLASLDLIEPALDTEKKTSAKKSKKAKGDTSTTAGPGKAQDQTASQTSQQADGIAPQETKRGRGRPRKPVDPNAPQVPKRGRGRPRKPVDPSATQEPKRGRGRPRKPIDPNALQIPKRGRGRPRKPVDPNTSQMPKRGRGRPRKQEEMSVSQVSK